MSKLARSIGRGLIDGFACMVSRNDQNSGLVRMFEVEYNKEARFARKSGAHIDENFVRSFLASNIR